MKILCLHGINTEENPGATDYWFALWQNSISAQLPSPDASKEFVEWRFNQYFNAVSSTPAQYLSALSQAVGSMLGKLWPFSRGPQDANPGSVSMVAKWLGEEGLRDQLRFELKKQIASEQPELIVAHSLGSLVLYDTLLLHPDLAQGRVIITLGSQISHPALCKTWGGYLPMIAQAKHWFHLYNPYDAVLAGQALHQPYDNFTQVTTDFMHDRPLNHDALCYFKHAQAVELVWSRLSIVVSRAVNAAGSSQLKLNAAPKAAVKPHSKQRALLVGINQYPNEKDRLSGCVNDVFSISAMLQSQGWSADNIRIVLDDRATTEGVLQRLQWLLADVRDDPNEVRLFYFSGHGAQLAQYDTHGEPDHLAETLVTHDMDWKSNIGITDKALAALYAHLPYQARLYMFLDCCHSGGLTRGSSPARGIEPPDDVAHRALRWDAKSRLWISRDLDLSQMLVDNEVDKEKYLGADHATHKLGRAVSLWNAEAAQDTKLRKMYKHKGAFNPVVITSCSEKQYAYEYRHGVESHGAFTYVLTQLMLRKQQASDLETLVARAGDLIHSHLKLDQQPRLYNPGNKAGLFSKVKSKEIENARTGKAAFAKQSTTKHVKRAKA